MEGEISLRRASPPNRASSPPYEQPLSQLLAIIYTFSHTLNISFHFSHLSLIFSSLSRGTTMKIRHLCPFYAITAISIAVHISVTKNNL